MIIDDTHRAAFVHIPKCAGTSVRRQLEPLNSYGDFFERSGTHPTLGLIHYGHVPLRFLRQCFPAEFDKLRAYRCFALTREPHARFASATFQRLEEFRGVPKQRVTAKLAISEARSVIAWLSDRGPFCDFEYIHFSRQIDYVALEGERIVENVFALENIEQMASGLEAAFGVRVDPERRDNTNLASGNRLFELLLRAKPVYSRLTTWAFRERLLLLLRRSVLQRPEALYEALRKDPEISRFVESYYAEDFQLYRASRARSDDASAGAAWVTTAAKVN